MIKTSMKGSLFNIFRIKKTVKENIQKNRRSEKANQGQTQEEVMSKNSAWILMRPQTMILRAMLILQLINCHQIISLSQIIMKSET